MLLSEGVKSFLLQHEIKGLLHVCVQQIENSRKKIETAQECAVSIPSL